MYPWCGVTWWQHPRWVCCEWVVHCDSNNEVTVVFIYVGLGKENNHCWSIESAWHSGNARDWTCHALLCSLSPTIECYNLLRLVKVFFFTFAMSAPRGIKLNKDELISINSFLEVVICEHQHPLLLGDLPHDHRGHAEQEWCYTCQSHSSQHQVLSFTECVKPSHQCRPKLHVVQGSCDAAYYWTAELRLRLLLVRAAVFMTPDWSIPGVGVCAWLEERKVSSLHLKLFRNQYFLNIGTYTWRGTVCSRSLVTWDYGNYKMTFLINCIQTTAHLEHNPALVKIRINKGQIKLKNSYVLFEVKHETKYFL